MEFICEFYLVVSIPEEDHTLAMVSLLDYNLQFDNLFKSFNEGQRIEVKRLSEAKKTSTISCPIMSILLLPLVWKTHPMTSTPLKKLSSDKENIFWTNTDIEMSNSGRSVQIEDLVFGKIIQASDGGALEGLKETSNGNPCPARITRDSVQRGDQLEGYISHFSHKLDCMFVQIGCDLIATVHHPHFGDEAIQNLSDHFQIGQQIKGIIVSFTYPKIGISLRLGKKPLAGNGQVKKGVITSVLPHGVYVRLEDFGIQGLVPKMEIQSHQKGMLKVGNIVSVKVDASTDMNSS
eukprot:g6911.t1